MRTFSEYIGRNKESLTQELEDVNYKLEQLRKQAGPNAGKTNELLRRQRNIQNNINQLNLTAKNQ